MRTVHRVLAGVMVASFGCVFALAINALAGSTPMGLTEPALRHLPDTGVTNPVTAVILNYRGYDTLVEIAVITMAALSVVELLGLGARSPASAGERDVLSGLVRGVAPIAVLFGAYLLWKGAKEPGGAFQGAAVITGALTLHWLTGGTLRHGDRCSRLVAVCGLATFVGVASALAIGDGTVLQYPPRIAGWLILVVEGACLVSLSVVLTWMIAAFGAPGSQQETPKP